VRSTDLDDVSFETTMKAGFANGAAPGRVLVSGTASQTLMWLVRVESNGKIYEGIHDQDGALKRLVFTLGTTVLAHNGGRFHRLFVLLFEIPDNASKLWTSISQSSRR
jgi:hypothetical protein